LEAKNNRRATKAQSLIIWPRAEPGAEPADFCGIARTHTFDQTARNLMSNQTLPPFGNG
jgi:hypothetical protein